jgi:hypothetical protein
VCALSCAPLFSSPSSRCLALLRLCSPAQPCLLVLKACRSALPRQSGWRRYWSDGDHGDDRRLGKLWGRLKCAAGAWDWLEAMWFPAPMAEHLCIAELCGEGIPTFENGNFMCISCPDLLFKIEGAQVLNDDPPLPLSAVVWCRTAKAAASLPIPHPRYCFLPTLDS